LVADILGAFDHACRERQFEAAAELLRIAEDVIARLAPGATPLAKRGAAGVLAAAGKRLQALHPRAPRSGPGGHFPAAAWKATLQVRRPGGSRFKR
jgi:hypothetical protein